MSLEDRFRQAFDDAIAEVRSRLESQFTSTLTDVRAEAEREKAEALAALEDAKRTELAAAEEARAAALAAAEEARSAALAAAEESQAAALAEAKGSLESELHTAFQSERAALTSNHDSVIAQLREAVESDRNRLLDEAAAEAARLREAADTAATAAQAELDQAKADLDQAVAEATRQREELEAALMQSKDAAAAEVEKARAEAQEAAAAHSQALDTQLTGASRLLESVRALDGAASLTEVLDALTFAAAKEAGRSAMLVVKGDRLIGWRTTGFGRIDDEPRAIESSTSDVDALAAAVNTGRPAVVGSGSVLAAPAFSQLPPDRPGLAVPLLVAGRPVAVLYTDPGHAAPLSPGWTSPVEVLVRHAGRCLEAIAVSRGHAKAAAARVGTPA